MNIREAKQIKVNNYIGSWSIIDDNGKYALLEHNTDGDETCYLVVEVDSYIMKDFIKKSDMSIVTLPYYENVIGETYDSLDIALEDLL